MKGLTVYLICIVAAVTAVDFFATALAGSLL
jgi:hypothetical protein